MMLGFFSPMGYPQIGCHSHVLLRDAEFKTTLLPAQGRHDNPGS